MAIRTVVVPASEVLPLRWGVLRPGLPREAAVFAADTRPDAFHVAAYDGAAAAVLGCGSFFPEPFRDAEVPAYRIRGMATARPVRGLGYGAAVLETATSEAISRGARLLWCNGRSEARGFYEALGYRVIGEEFVIDGVGPHHVLVRELD